MDKHNVGFWKALHPGSFVTLSDKQTLDLAFETSGSMEGIQYEIKKIITVTEQDNLMSWLFFQLEGPGDRHVWLMVKIVDQDFDLRVYCIPEDFNKGDRKDQIDWENFWLFQEPEDEDNVDPLELKFTTEMEHEGTDYSVKPPGELFGTAKEYPEPSGQIDCIVATVVEYSAEDDDDAANPEALFLELGNPDSGTGGLITMFVGSNLSLGEVDVLAK